MSTYTDLYCHLTLCKETLDSKSRLLEYIDTTKRDLEMYKEDLKALIMTTEPTKVFDEESTDMSPFEYMKYRFREDIDGIKECFYKLWVYDCYLQCWDKCHDDKGYANGMPDFCSSYDEAFMCGSWVDTTKWTRKDFMDKIRSGSDA